MSVWIAVTMAFAGTLMLCLLVSRSFRSRLDFHLTAAAFSQKRDLAIDGIRGLVSSAVVLGHFGTMPSVAPVKVIGSSAFIWAVSTFAAMSGYVLYAGMARARVLTGEAIKSYLIRRLTRVYPLYAVYFVMMVTAIFMIGNSTG